MGTVYFAKNRFSLQNVAIKVLDKAKVNHEHFKNEYEAMTKVNHPNIVKTIEIWEWNQSLFLVSEYCEGGDLFEYIYQKKRLDEP